MDPDAMLPDIFTSLTTMTSTEILHTLVSAHMYLKELEYTEHDLELDEVLDTNGATASDVVDAVIAIYDNHLNNALREMGVSVSREEHINTTTLLSLCKVITALGDQGNQDVVMISEGATDTTVGRLASVSPMLGGPSEHEIYTHVLDVESHVFNNKQVVEDDVDPDLQKHAVSRYRKYIGSVREGAVYELISTKSWAAEGKIPLSPYAVASALQVKLQTIPSQEALVREFVSLAMLSSVPDANLEDTAIDLVDNFIDSKTAVMVAPKITTALKEYFNVNEKELPHTSP